MDEYSKKNSSINEQRHIDSLLLLADWDNGDIEKVSSSKSIIYVSLKNSVTGLAFFYDTNNKSIDSSNLIYIKAANNSFLNKPIKAVVSYYVTEILKRDYALGFSGTFASYTLRNKYQHEYGFKDGVILWRKFMAPKSRTDVTTKKSNTSKKDYFECEWWGNFTRWADGSITLNYVYQVCYECQTTSIGITTGGQYIKNQCGGGGGSSSSSTNTTLLGDIFVSLQHPCFSEVYNKLITSGMSTQITNILRNTFGLNSKMNLRLYDVSTISDPNPDKIIFARTPFASFDEYGFINIEIALNISTMGEASQEFIATVIMHEICHAYLHANQINPAQQHQSILDNYTSAIANSLRVVFPNSSVNMDELSKLGIYALENSTTYENRRIGGQGIRCQQP